MSLYKKSIDKVSNKPKTTRDASNRQESKVAKIVGGKKTANSGAPMFTGGDVTSEQFLIECKTKMKPSDSISIKKEWLTKIKEEASFVGKKHTALVFNFGPDEPNYAIVDMYLFNSLLDALEKGLLDE